MSTTTVTDPLALTKALVQQASVTPAASGALDIVQQWAETLGGQCRRLPRGEVDNLYVRFGTKALTYVSAVMLMLCLSAIRLIGRMTRFPPSSVMVGCLGAEPKMKSGVACWMAATARS